MAPERRSAKVMTVPDVRGCRARAVERPSWHIHGTSVPSAGVAAFDTLPPTSTFSPQPSAKIALSSFPQLRTRVRFSSPALDVDAGPTVLSVPERATRWLLFSRGGPRTATNGATVAREAGIRRAARGDDGSSSLTSKSQATTFARVPPDGTADDHRRSRQTSVTAGRSAAGPVVPAVVLPVRVADDVTPGRRPPGGACGRQRAVRPRKGRPLDRCRIGLHGHRLPSGGSLLLQRERARLLATQQPKPAAERYPFVIGTRRSLIDERREEIGRSRPAPPGTVDRDLGSVARATTMPAATSTSCRLRTGQLIVRSVCTCRTSSPNSSEARLTWCRLWAQARDEHILAESHPLVSRSEDQRLADLLDAADELPASSLEVESPSTRIRSSAAPPNDSSRSSVRPPRGLAEETTGRHPTVPGGHHPAPHPLAITTTGSIQASLNIVAEQSRRWRCRSIPHPMSLVDRQLPHPSGLPSLATFRRHPSDPRLSFRIGETRRQGR